ncbi:MAG: hypothetical protein AB7O67_10095 [Vicinamibacterales bacterium]
MTGRGYHFAAAVPLGHAIVDALAALAPGVPAWLASVDGRRAPFRRPPIDERQARAATALGMVLEHVAHGILAGSARQASLPVVLNGTVVGVSGPAGRACASVDLSFAGDPLDVRHVRMAFGGYHLHQIRPDIFGSAAASRPALVALPRTGDEWRALVRSGRGVDVGAALAGASDVRMPDGLTGLAGLLADYQASPLAVHHARFYAETPEPPSRWPETYDVVSLGGLPPCVRAALRTPNDLLLQPAHVQHLTRTLLAEGWHPRHVAGLVWSRYARDHGWGDRWRRHMDAATRADFDVRVFSGLLAAGLDRGLDLNCVSAQEKGLCTHEACGRDLRVYRDRLRARYPS